MFYTYSHTKQDGTIFYIGKGQGKRLTAKSGRNKHWHNLVNKHGLNANILAYWKTEDEAYDHEKLLISCFKDMGYEMANYKNGGEGGGCGNKHSQEFKEKMRNLFKGISKTAEHRAKISAGNIGVKRPFIRAEKNGNFKSSILATNKITGDTIKITGSLQMTSLGFDDSHVYACLNGRLKSHKGHTFTRIEA